jgi:hypothetical protein
VGTEAAVITSLELLMSSEFWAIFSAAVWALASILVRKGTVHANASRRWRERGWYVIRLAGGNAGPSHKISASWRFNTT